MKFLDLTLPSPAENVALDEALLAASEAGQMEGYLLRVWEPTDYFVVLGRSIDPVREVNLATCREERIPVLRRVSGGGTVVAGPGCLSYALILARDRSSALSGVDTTHAYVLDRLVAGLSAFAPVVHRQGISDLAISNSAGVAAKVSGNALRIHRRGLLYHGTLLYNFDLPRISRYLATPQREPDYRAGRRHEQFVANLPLAREVLVSTLRTVWNAQLDLENWPVELTKCIVAEKYTQNPHWLIA